MNNIKDCIRIVRQSVVASCFLLVLILTGCSDDLGQGFTTPGSGEKVHATVSVPLGSPVTDVRSRSVDFSDNAEMKIDSYWIGIYDTKTGELVGSRMEKTPRKGDGNRYTVKSTTPFVAEDIDIYYYDSNPEVYIVGVINFLNITARKVGGEEQPLEELLENATTFDYLHDISVNTASADKANPQESNGLNQRPLMMGYYTTGNSNLHTNIMPDGSLSQDNIKIRLTSTDSNYSSVSLPEGNIRLQRLLAEINVTVTGDGVALLGVRYRVVNNPKEVYLGEHQIENALIATYTNKQDYLNATPNSADFLEDGYTSESSFKEATQVQNTSGPGNNSYAFSYQNYENKHWGRSYNGNSYRAHAYREEKYDSKVEKPEDAVWRALCPNTASDFNNNAPYFILSVDIDMYNPDEDGSVHSYQGTVEYIIHEGYACSMDGHASTNLYDFQRIRNMRYNYNIVITGLEDLRMNVTTSSMHNDGISGEMWETDIKMIPSMYPSPIPVRFTYDDCVNFMWRFWERKLDGDEINVGEYTPLTDAPEYFPDWNYSGEELHSSAEEIAFLDEIIGFSTIDYDSNPMTFSQFLNQIKTYPGNYQYYVYISNYTAEDFSQPDANQRGFYFFKSPTADNDGCTTMVAQLIGFEQEGADTRHGSDLKIAGYPGKIQYDINMPGGYYEGNDDYVYNYSPFFQKDYYEEYGYTKNERFWSGALNTGAYIRFYDDNGFRDKFIIEIYDVSDNYPELILNLNHDDHCIYNGHDGTFLYEIKGEELAQLSPGYHTVHIKPNGDPSIYQPGTGTVLYKALHIMQRTYWDLNAQWEGGQSIAYYFVADPNVGSYQVIDFGGLTVVGGRKFVGTGGGGMQTGRPGFPYSKSDANKGGYFKITVNKPGQVKVRAINNSAGTDRRVCLYKPRYEYLGEDCWSDLTTVYESPKEYIQLDNKKVSTINEYILKTGEIDGITDLMICATDNMYITSIEFEESDDYTPSPDAWD